MDASPTVLSSASCPGRAGALTVHHDVKTHPIVLPCRMLLHEALERFDLAAHPYFLLADDAGMLIGVLAPEEIASRIGSWNEIERKRWADMPLEGLLKHVWKRVTSWMARPIRFHRSPWQPCRAPCSSKAAG